MTRFVFSKSNNIPKIVPDINYLIMITKKYKKNMDYYEIFFMLHNNLITDVNLFIK